MCKVFFKYYKMYAAIQPLPIVLLNADVFCVGMQVLTAVSNSYRLVHLLFLTI